MRKNRVILWKI